MTQDQIRKLHQAIERALGPGAKQYVVDGKPGCVIAQLASLEGISVERMLTWYRDTIRVVLERGKAPELMEYSWGLLTELQEAWDVGSPDTACRTRVRMHRSVDPNYADAAGI